MRRIASLSLVRRLAGLAAVIVAAGALASSAPDVAGRVEHVSIKSPALGRVLPVSVYVPHGAAPAGGWPVLYLLHGLGGCERDWLELGGVKTTLDRLIATDHIRPMMVVMPSAGSSWYVDSAGLGGPGNYETALIEDLPKAVEARFPAAASPRERAIAGVSMGGYGALRLAFKHPDMFAAVASMSGAIWQNLPGPAATAQADAYEAFRDDVYFGRKGAPAGLLGMDLPPEGAHFGAAFGQPFDADRFNTQNVFTLLTRQTAKKATLPAIYLTVGDHDSHNLWRGSIALYQALRDRQQPVEFRVTDGDHTWALWRRSIEDTLMFVDRSFAPGTLPMRTADRGVPTTF